MRCRAGHGLSFSPLVSRQHALVATMKANDADLVEVNPALARMLGYDDERDLMRMKVADLYQRPSDRMEFSERLSREGILRQGELELRKKDGSPIVVSETAVAVKDAAGNVLHFDGTIEELDVDSWEQMEIEAAEPPEDWSGSVDVDDERGAEEGAEQQQELDPVPPRERPARRGRGPGRRWRCFCCHCFSRGKWRNRGWWVWEWHL